MYKATIYFTAEEVVFNDGCTGKQVNSWTEVFEDNDKQSLKNTIADATYSTWSEIDQLDINDYEHATEYFADYYANEDNEGSATESEMEQWRLGKQKLFLISCHILVSEVTESKVLL